MMLQLKNNIADFFWSKCKLKIGILYIPVLQIIFLLVYIYTQFDNNQYKRENHQTSSLQILRRSKDHWTMNK